MREREREGEDGDDDDDDELMMMMMMMMVMMMMMMMRWEIFKRNPSQALSGTFIHTHEHTFSAALSLPLTTVGRRAGK